MRFLRAVLICFLLILVVVSILIPILGSTFGKSVARLEILTSLRLQYGLLVSLIFVGALLLRSRILILTSFAALLFHAAAILPYYFASSRPPGEGPPLRVLSFNVLGHSRNYPAVVEYVKKERPDVAVFQEITDKWADGLAPLGDDYPHHYRATSIDGLVYSRYPIEYPEVVLVGERRGYVQFRIRHEGREVVIIATHAYPQFPFGPQGFHWRNEHLTEILPKGVNETANLPTIVLGDLNAGMWSPHFRELIAKTGLHEARKGFGIYPSCGAYLEYTSLIASPYDHCLFNDHVSVSRFWTGPNLNSDHYPVLAELYIEK